MSQQVSAKQVKLNIISKQRPSMKITIIAGSTVG